MHRLAALPGGWNPDTNGTIFIEQNSASIVMITAADTDIQTLAASIVHFPVNFPSLRVVNLLQLQQQLSIDTYRDRVLIDAKVIILRLLGGISYWSYGLEILKETVESTKATLFVLPGDDRPDLQLISHSNASLVTVNKLWRYFSEGGVENYTNALKFITNLYLNTSYSFAEPKPVSKIGLYQFNSSFAPISGDRSQTTNNAIGILFYRAHYLAGNTLAIDSLSQELLKRNLEPIPIYVSSLQDEEVQTELIAYLQENNSTNIQLLLNTTSFSLAKLGSEEQPELWKTLDIPILQVILSSSTQEQWESGFAGLTPRDVAMNVALPEVDGRIITRAVSFKSVQTWNEQLETDVVVYQPRSDRLEFVADLAANWVSLQQTSRSQRKIALILANYPNKDGRIANGVGLDTPASCIEILKALQEAGYAIEDIPKTGEELIRRLTAGVTNDLEGRRRLGDGEMGRWGDGYLEVEEYQKYFETLPEKIQQEVIDRWGEIEVRSQQSGVSSQQENNLSIFDEKFLIPGIQLGNVFVGIQPSRGYDLDPSLNYHAPDLEPTHNYLAYYYWLREKFGAQAIVHVGKHGNLEWLPGKSIALSESCYPEVTLGSIPNFYPFIVNDPGEGSQAKRRSHATIIDHLTPPLTRAELYGSLQKLEALIDEYYEAQTLDPSRLKIISDRITQLVKQENLDRELGIESTDPNSIAEFLSIADGYLCELKEAQIRDGLHIFGKCPQGTQLRDLIIAIARSPSIDRSGFTQAIAEDLNLELDPLTANPTERFFYGEEGRRHSSEGRGDLLSRFKQCLNVGDAIALIEEIAAELVDNLLTHYLLPIPHSPFPIPHYLLPITHSPLPTTYYLFPIPHSPLPTTYYHLLPNSLPKTEKQLQWIKNHLLPCLQQTDREISNLIKGLDGKYVPPGASGAPTRGRPDVLPTGRNFYSVDIRAIPTETAWDVGRKAAEVVIERYTQENGEYPQSLAISIWGTSTMRTGGDDVAQVLALMGVRPIWDGLSRRVVDFEILPTSILGRPRVDVTIRVSGFFRDSFPNLLNLLYNAIEAIASLKEDFDLNPLADRVEKEKEFWQREGLAEEQAQQRSLYRIFTSKPGAYGAGLQGLIEAQNWQDDRDLARAYINWSSYAYGSGGKINAAPEAFSDRLKQLEIVLHNQDNREHDLLDSDDYYQFQGGLTVAVRALTGKNPTTYFGDNSIPANPKVKLLKEEIAKVYRSRVINPKWMEGVMRHGYKGAFEIAATVDYLFAYDATARCVEDYIYEGVAQAYLLDEKVQQFIGDRNPWALRDMAERLLEANQRGLWKSVDTEMLDRLKAIANDAEGIIETNAEN